MRSSGILMHITSLPGPYGVGTMGRQAYSFVDFLRQSGQSCWQILPLSPTGYGDSPYQSCSAFAGNHYLIDLPSLVDQGLLREEELTDITWCRQEDRADFSLLYKNRLKVLKKAWERFRPDEAFAQFCRDNSGWLSDFCLFMALKDRYQGKPWYTWEKDLKFRQCDAVWQARQELEPEIRFYSFVQYLFFTQWNALHAYAKAQGVEIIGDVPIYVPLDSVEVWSSPELFRLDGELVPTAVAGCPPDAFSEDGQLWGNPLYRWEEMEKDGYSWWLRRLEAAGRLYDTVRLDHFRGFEAYWSVPYGEKTARNGQWIQGPGLKFIETVKQALPGLSFIAEDLGFLTPEVLELRDRSGFPGMKVLEFAFDSREPSDYLPHNYEKNTVCYVGTHDNMTMRQWFGAASQDARDYAGEYMHLSEKEGPVWGVIRTAASSVSDLCIFQMQDLLNLDGRARMNFPGTLSDKNWTWRMKDDMISLALAEKLRKLTALYDRLGNQKNESAAKPLEMGEQK